MASELAEQSQSDPVPTGAAIEATSKRKYFRFLGLPAELRNDIYRRLLENNNTVIDLICARRRNKPPRIKRDGFWKDKFLFAETSAIALLRTNKQIHLEGLAILYGENTFVFQDITAFRRFLEIIGIGVKYVQSIRMNADTLYGCSLRPALKTFCRAENLRLFHVYHPDICQDWGATALKFVKQLSPLLDVLAESWKGRGKVDTSVADLVLVDFPECDECYNSCFDECLEKNSCGCTCLEGRKKSEAMTREIGELIAVRYGVEYHHNTTWWSLGWAEPVTNESVPDVV